MTFLSLSHTLLSCHPLSRSSLCSPPLPFLSLGLIKMPRVWFDFLFCCAIGSRDGICGSNSCVRVLFSLSENQKRFVLERRRECEWEGGECVECSLGFVDSLLLPPPLTTFRFFLCFFVCPPLFLSPPPLPAESVMSLVLRIRSGRAVYWRESQWTENQKDKIENTNK